MSIYFHNFLYDINIYVTKKPIAKNSLKKQKPPEQLFGGSGDPPETRTPDPLIKSQVLYHLS